MNDKIKDKKVKFNINKNNPSELTSYIIYLNYYDFDIRYDILSPNQRYSAIFPTY